MIEKYSAEYWQKKYPPRVNARSADKADKSRILVWVERWGGRFEPVKP